jgi:hypothetical protein
MRTYMIRFAGKKKYVLFRNSVLSLVLFAVVVSSVVIAPKNASAFDTSMSTIFKVSTTGTDVGTGLPGIITQIPYSGSIAAAGAGVNPSKYIVSPDSLKLSLDPVRLSEGNTFKARYNGFFLVNINLGNNEQAFADLNNNGRVDNDTELGSWKSVYSSTNLQNNGKPLSNIGGAFGDTHGMWLDIGTMVKPGDSETVLTNVITSPPIMPKITDDMAADAPPNSGYIMSVPLDAAVDFGKTSMQIPIQVALNSHFFEGVTYYARIRLEETNTSADASSNIVSFKVGSDVSAENMSTAAIQVTTGEQATGSTNNAGLLLAAAVCEFSSPSTWFTGCMVRAFYHLVWTPSAWILGGAGWLLDSSIAFSISTNIYNNPTFISSGWGIVRDISNLLFIAMLIYVAFGLILDLKKVDAKKMIVSLVVMAVLINFSLFFTKVVIDSSNILARIFYRQIVILGTPSDASSASSTDIVNATGVEVKSLSQALMDGFDVNKMLSIETLQKMNAEGKGDEPGFVFLIILLAVLLNLVAAWIFFICALLFIGRIAGLWISMIFSAFAFMSFAVPWVGGIKRLGWHSWIEDLMGVAFLAPIFIFFMYLIISFVNTKFLDGLFLHIKNFTMTQFIIALIIQFVILIMLLKQSKELAMKLAGEAGGAIVNGLKGAGAAVGGFVTGAALAAVSGGTSLVARNTIGALGNKVANSDTLKAREAKGGIPGWIARQQLNAGKYLGSASFDPRATKTFQGAMAGVTDTIGYKPLTGTAHKGGFAEDKKAMATKREERFKELKTTKTTEELTAADPENKKKKLDYENNLLKYAVQKNSDYKEWSRDKRTKPGFDEAKAKGEFEQEYKDNKNNPKPTPPTYTEVTQADYNKKLQKDYTDYLQGGTVRAGVQDATGIKTAGRAGELDAIKNIEKAQKNTEGLEHSQQQLTKQVERLTGKIDKYNQEFKKQNITSEPAKQEFIDKEIARKETENERQKAQIKEIQKAFNKMPENASGRDAEFEKLSELRVKQKAHEHDLKDMKDAFVNNGEGLTKAKASLDDVKTKLKGPSGAPKKEEKKEEKK